MKLTHDIFCYKPYNEQEEKDRKLILALIDQAEGEGAAAVDRMFERPDPAHFTASGWVVSPDRAQVLMAYHNLYDSWSWLGGHADGQRDLSQVALREVQEESGLTSARLAADKILSLEVLTVSGHVKRGSYVSSHLHLNLTYLVEADPDEAPRVKPDENSRIAWMNPQEALASSSEPWFVEHVYTKLMRKCGQLS